MEKIISMFLLIIMASTVPVLSDGNTKAISEIDMKLNLLNKPAVMTIQSEDGDIIDCVDVYKQPALDHPSLKNHKIQMRPSFIPTERSNTVNKASRPVVSQTWQKSGSCPEGTVPIRRIQREDLLRAASVETFGRKTPDVGFKNTEPLQINNTNLKTYPLANRSDAVLLTVGYSYIGAAGDINVWNPYVESTEDYTTAQIWLKGLYRGAFDSVEAGWMVNPKLYGDKRTRLFAHWTRDEYKTTGCFDLTCNGFVQTSSKIALGSTIDPVSTISSQQYIIHIGIFKDSKTGNWWLHFGSEDVVGYWPGSLFNTLQHTAANLVEWGGEVYSPNVKKTPHTKTAMGSGSFSQGLWGDACFIQHVRIMDYSLQLKYPEWVGTRADEVYCYNAYNHVKSYPAEPIFYFGGAGGHYRECL